MSPTVTSSYKYNDGFLKIHLSFGSVQFNCSVVSDSLPPHGLQHSPLKLMSIISVMSSNIECQVNVKKATMKTQTMESLPLIALSRENKIRQFVFFVQRKAPFSELFLLLRCLLRSLTFHFGLRGVVSGHAAWLVGA